MGCLCCPWLSISALKRRAVVMTRSSKYAPEGPQEIYTERPHSGDPGVQPHAMPPAQGAVPGGEVPTAPACENQGTPRLSGTARRGH